MRVLGWRRKEREKRESGGESKLKCSRIQDYTDIETDTQP